MTAPTTLLTGPPAGDRRWWVELALPIGDGPLDVVLVSDGEALVEVGFVRSRERRRPAAPASWKRDPAPLAGATEQLRGYAAGELTQFDLELRPTGTPFQHQVWTQLLAIGYGTTTTYGRIARDLGLPDSARAVGAAVGANPLAIVVPCHRVIGADGSLTGYAGGLGRKVALLRLEGVMAL
ncbi:MAG: methylated-DNA--[protein]-cysteine S-methyltransferase [Acidimicrobiales bacterium]